MLDDAQARLTELAAAVADGRTLDWDTIESSARDETERVLIRRLRAIADIGRLHSDLTLGDSASQSVSLGDALGTTVSGDPALTSWGPLQILEKVGRGRFGDVFRAWDPSLDREVALKLLRRREADPVGEDRIVIEEGRLMARVRHPNVVTIYGAQRIEGRTGLWMEFIHGRTLEAELKERGPLPAAEIAQVGVELCRALGAVHSAGLVHRDVKAQNVLRDPTGRVLLGDFGTGRELDDAEASRGELAGTPAYLAPEIFKRIPATPQSDLYSLGALLFHLATGTYPVRGRTIRALRQAHENEERVSIHALHPDLPRPLADAIDRALNQDPARRFENAAAMEQALQLQQAGSVAVEHDKTNRPDRRVAIATILTAAVGAAIWNRARGTFTTATPAGSGTADMSSPGSANARGFRRISTDPTLAGPGITAGAPSPDGRLLSTVQSNELALHEIATGRRWMITQRPAGGPPGGILTSRFSLDGSRVTYLRNVGPTDPPLPEIRVVPVSGGPGRLVWSGTDSRGREIRLQHWAGDDHLILVARQTSSADTELLVIATDRGNIQTAFTVPSMWRPNASIWLVGASLSPDGRLVAYTRVDRSTRRSDIYLHTLDDGSDTALIRDASRVRSPLWTHDGRHLLFLSEHEGTTDLRAQRVEGNRPEGTPVRIAANLGTVWPIPGLTKSGALFFRRRTRTQDLYVVDIDPGTLELRGEPHLVYNDDATNGPADWSPDGQRLAFARTRDDRGSLIVRSLADGREQEIRHPLFGGGTRPRWEPGGRSILVRALVGGRNMVRRVHLDTGEITTVMERAFVEFELMPQAGAILYSERNKREVIRYDLSTGSETLIHRIPPQSTLVEMSVSHAGDRLAYTCPVAGMEWAVRIVDLSQPNAREIFRDRREEYMNVNAWSLDDRKVIVSRGRNISTSRAESELWAIDVQTGEARLMGRLNLHGVIAVRLSPNGRQLSFISGLPLQEVWVLDDAVPG